MKLSLDKSNDILFQAFGDQNLEAKKELLEKELDVVADLLFEKMCELCDELTGTYDSELFSEVENIKNNGEHLLNQLIEVNKQIEANADNGAEEQEETE